MSRIRTTEREIAAGSASWLNDYCRRKNLAFTEVSVEAQARGDAVDGAAGLRYGDVILWRDRQSGRASVLLELKSPTATADTHDILLQRANAFGVPYVVAWNFQQIDIYTVGGVELRRIHSQKAAVLEKLEDWTRPGTRKSVRAALETLCGELDQLVNQRPFRRYKPDGHYFVEFVRQSVHNLAHIVEHELQTALNEGMDISGLTHAYLTETRSSQREDILQVVALQIVYRLLVKLMLYQAMQRHVPGLAAIDTERTEGLGQRIRRAFHNARSYGPHVVFADDPFDEHVFSVEAEEELLTFIRTMVLYDFEGMAEDIVGRMFEKIIEPELRHRLGQYYTPEDLVDLVIGLTAKDLNGTALDPTCGSGTFLLRYYDLLRTRMGHTLDHAERLKRIVGVEISRFPASLAALNLTRQDLSHFREPAHIVHSDIFDVLAFGDDEALTETDSSLTTLPRPIDTVFGNMPFIRHELIERSGADYKQKLQRRLAHSLLFSDTYLFNLAGDASERLEYVAGLDRAQQIRWIDGLLDSKKLKLAVSGTADLFVYILFRLLTLLTPDGRIGIISSNAWLDTRYGRLLQQFLLHNFHIETVVASWAEPWFDDASINTVVTVLQRRAPHKANAGERTAFVSLRKNLQELLPTRDLLMHADRRWNEVTELVHQFSRHVAGKSGDSVHSTGSKAFRLRSVPRSALEIETEDTERPARWSKYLRAPDVYFDILEQCADRLTDFKDKADIRPGVKSGINDFFYVRVLQPAASADATEPVLIETAGGRRFSIEQRFLTPVIKSPRELTQIAPPIETDFKYHAFVCDVNKEILLREGFIGAAEYVEWGESMANKSGVPWPKVSSVKQRRIWHALRRPGQSDLLLPMSNDKRFAVFEAPRGAMVDHNMFECTVLESAYRNTATRYCNSLLFALFREVNARVNLGDGASKTELVDWKYMPVPRDVLDLPEDKPAFFRRRILSIDRELNKKDRQDFEAEILAALGLDPVVYLDAIKAGVKHMVADRIQPSTQRKKRRSEVKAVAHEDIRKQIGRSVFPRGARKFPDDFYPRSNFTGDKLCLPGGKLHIESMLGRHVVKDDFGRELYSTFSAEQARYLLACAQGPAGKITVPFDELLSELMMREYTTYYNDQRERVYIEAMQRLHDQSAARRMCSQILAEMKLQAPPDWQPPY